MVCACTNNRYQATSSSPCGLSIRLHAHNARECGDLDNYSRKLLNQIWRRINLHGKNDFGKSWDLSITDIYYLEMLEKHTGISVVSNFLLYFLNHSSSYPLKLATSWCPVAHIVHISLVLALPQVVRRFLMDMYWNLYLGIHMNALEGNSDSHLVRMVFNQLYSQDPQVAHPHWFVQAMPLQRGLWALQATVKSDQYVSSQTVFFTLGVQ